MEAIETLGIDLKLLLTQILNFLILFFILYHFAYKPLLNMLDKRKKMIEESAINSERINKESIELENKKEQILTDARKEALKIIEESKREGAKIKEESVKDAREQSRSIIEKAKLQIEAEKEEKFKELKKEVGELALIGVNLILKEKMNEKIDQKIIKEALKNMEVN